MPSSNSIQELEITDIKTSWWIPIPENVRGDDKSLSPWTSFKLSISPSWTSFKLSIQQQDNINISSKPIIFTSWPSPEAMLGHCSSLNIIQKRMGYVPRCSEVKNASAATYDCWLWRNAQLKKYGESRTFCKSKSPRFGNGGKVKRGYVLWKPSSNCQQIKV